MIVDVSFRGVEPSKVLVENIQKQLSKLDKYRKDKKFYAKVMVGKEGYKKRVEASVFSSQEEHHASGKGSDYSIAIKEIVRKISRQMKSRNNNFYRKRRSAI